MGNSNCQRLDCASIVAPRDYVASTLCHASSPSLHLFSERLPSRDVQVSAERFKRRRWACGESPARGNGVSLSTGAVSCDEEARVASWRDHYIVRRVLGSGQSATVYEAFSIDDPEGSASVASATSADAGAVGRDAAKGGIGAPSAPGDVSGAESQRPLGRQVALKHFLRPNSLMLRRELVTLAAVGSHPNITRLLEFFEGGVDGDALILEYCDGGDVYDFYAASKGHGIHEGIVGQIIRQLLTALAHLASKSVDHRDVKPENLLLYGPTDLPYPHVKLADFGWALINRDSIKVSLPPEGVGSLWYAAPELNPPLPGGNRLDEAPMLGASDMWSAGVITFLLLVGHNPFNKALNEKEPKAVEREVIRIAALGEVNMRTKNWLTLSDHAKNFILSLIQPNAKRRPSASEALQHPFIIKSGRGSCGEDRLTGSLVCQEDILRAVSDYERNRVWRAMDGFQQLCWMGLASAVSEPELLQERLSRQFSFQTRPTWAPGGYLERLAAELAVVATPEWFQAKSQGGWAHIARLAFHYLDIDCDGLISVTDLYAHAESADKDVVRSWIEKWRNEPGRLPVQDGLQFSDFRWTLWLTCIRSRSQNVGMGVEFEDGFGAIEAAASFSPGGAANIDFVDDWCASYVDHVLYPDE